MVFEASRTSSEVELMETNPTKWNTRYYRNRSRTSSEVELMETLGRMLLQFVSESLESRTSSEVELMETRY